jgi:GNAT superfamily N-acetyltransferase
MEPSETRPKLIFTPEASPDEATIRAVGGGLDAYNDLFAPQADWTERWIIGRDTDGVVQAGIRFVLSLDWLFVKWLWVAEPYRKQGIGSRLLAGAEAAARERQCRGAYLDTFTFQAPKFYDRHGYREFARLDDFPRGHARIWLSKPL